MIFGPSGAGKEQVARTRSHTRSQRAGGPFVVLNAAAIIADNMETELFGTEPRNGAARRVGALEEAHGGTLYLDEIADMPRETQNKILRVLVDQTFERVGGVTKVKVDVRVPLVDRARSRGRDSGRPFSRGPFPSLKCSAAPRALARRTARGRPAARIPFHGSALRLDRAGR